MPRPTDRSEIKVTDREQLDTKIRVTVEWNFGTVCDRVRALAADGAISAEHAEELVRLVRKNGNDIHRVILNHIRHYNLVRNHKLDEVNIPRVVRKSAQPEGQ